MDPTPSQLDPIQDKKSTSYWRRVEHPRMRSVVGRWWWLVMPLLGLVCAEAYVGPHVADSEDAVNRILKFEQDTLEELEAISITTDNELLAVQDVIDTLWMPELQWSARTRDSLLAVRSEIEQRFPLLERQIENLNGQLLALEEPIQDARLAKQQREREITEHQAMLATLRDSLVVLEQQREALDDRLYRLQHPEEFDRSRGLIDPRREAE